MLSSYYDPYRSVPEINKNAYYNYTHHHQHQTQQPQPNYGAQFQQAPGTKWASSFQINSQQTVVPTPNYLDRENNSSNESHYSQTPSLQKTKLLSVTPTPKKMVINGFSESSSKTQRIYKTHSDLNKEKNRVKKAILKGDLKSMEFLIIFY